MKFNLVTILIAISLLLISGVLEGQEALSTSQVWYGNALRAWFPEKIEFYGSSYYITRIRCSNKDITHFKAEAGKNNAGFESTFQIEGSLIIDALPSNLKVVDGVKGKKFMLQLQGYLFSQQGELLWSQEGSPIGESWISSNGAKTKFKLIDKYSGSIKGCTAVILAIGDPILVEGSSETKVIFGMKRYSFNNEDKTSSYYPTNAKPVKTIETKQISSTPNKKYNHIKYVKKKIGYFTYNEAVTIPVKERKNIFYKLVEYQDRTGNDEGAFKVIAKRFKIPEKAVSAISGEGTVKNWPMPDLP